MAHWRAIISGSIDAAGAGGTGGAAPPGAGATRSRLAFRGAPSATGRTVAIGKSHVPLGAAILVAQLLEPGFESDCTRFKGAVGGVVGAADDHVPP